MSQPPYRLNFSRPPKSGTRYLSIATSRKPVRLEAGQSVPDMEAVQASRKIDFRELRHYCRVCGLADNGTLPLTYPHVLAARAQLALLSSKAFPLRLLGLVHLRNEILQYSQIAVADKLGVRINVGGHRETDKGQEFDIVTRVTRGDELVWLETSTALARAARPAGSRSTRSAEPELERMLGDSVSWQAPENAGRSYARVSGDFNPIHLFRTTARWFGFRQPIAHGMWTLARCLGELDIARSDGRCSVTTNFGKPLYLPGWSVLSSTDDGATMHYRLTDPEKRRVFLSGAIERF
jgi:hypothetical protein